MPDDMTQLNEQLVQTVAVAEKLATRVKTLEDQGAGIALAKAAADKATADAVRLSDKLDEVERKFLAQGNRQIIMDVTTEKRTKLHAEFAAVGDFWKSGKLTDETRKIMTLAEGSDNSTTHYVVMPPVMAAGIQEILRDFSPMEQICDVETIDGTVWERVKQTAGGSAGRVSERGTRSATDRPTFGKDRIDTEGYYVYPTLTQEELWKAREFDLGAFVMSDGNFEIQELVEADYMTGSGANGRPFGLLSNATIQADYVASGNATTIDSVLPLIELTGKVHDTMLTNARFMMKRSTYITIAQITDGMDRPMLLQTLAAGLPAMFNGYPVIFNAYMPAISAYATNPYAVLFGDFRQGYKIIISRFNLLIRDEVTSPGYVKLYKEIKKGGDCRRAGDAIAPLKVAAS